MRAQRREYTEENTYIRAQRRIYIGEHTYKSIHMYESTYKRIYIRIPI